MGHECVAVSDGDRRTREGELEAYTEPPCSLDYPECKVVSDFGLGLLQVVSGEYTVHGAATLPQGLALKATVI